MPDRPNVLLILTDQHRLSAVGAYGPTPCRTPNLDRLASEGVLFENAYTACPVCSPARATIMTGLYPHRHGICANVHGLGCNVPAIVDSPELLSRRLNAAGYGCGYSGKWHLCCSGDDHYSEANRDTLPRDVGFEGHNFPNHGGGGFLYPEYRQYLEAGGWEHRVLPWDEKTRRVWHAGALDGPIESTVPYFLVENTLSLMESFQSRSQPFFIWHNFWGPHCPYYAPREFVEMYRDVEIPPWPNYEWDGRSVPGPHHAHLHPRAAEFTWEDWAGTIRYYYAFASLIDSQIGRMLDAMRQRGLLENTVVIFTSDHGETLGSHGGMTDKGWVHWEETHRIPFIVRRPGEEGGRRVEEFVSNADVYHTALDLAGAEPSRETAHGRSLVPLLEGRTESWREHVVTEFCGVMNQAMTQRTLRVGNIKYGYNCCAEDELYDLKRDPHEVENLVRDPAYGAALFDCRRRLAEWMRETGDRAEGEYRRQISAWHPELGAEDEPWNAEVSAAGG